MLIKYFHYDTAVVESIALDHDFSHPLILILVKSYLITHIFVPQLITT